MSHESKSGLAAVALAVASCGAAPAQTPVHPRLDGALVDAVMPEALDLYRKLHLSPELSEQEKNTATLVAQTMRLFGFDVQERVGGYGVVGLLKNGPGPVLMMRTDMDALPVEERTGAACASKVRAVDGAGREVPVMHACGHDLHMAGLLGTAKLLSTHRNLWSGTLMLVGQPAEEKLSGARAMLKDGLFTRWQKPDVALAIHVHDKLPVRTVGYTLGPFAASADSVNLEVFGRGGHGAYPQDTIDPIVISAQIVIALQTIVSRESSPFDPVVVSVGSIHGGVKHNTIPDSVRLELTVRTYHPETRQRVLKSIARIAEGVAHSASATRSPTMTVVEGTATAVSDEERTKFAVEVLAAQEPSLTTTALPPEMGSEDFSEYAAAGVPSVMLQVGVVSPRVLEEHKTQGKPLASIHSSEFFPYLPDSLWAAIQVESSVALGYLSAQRKPH